MPIPLRTAHVVCFFAACLAAGATAPAPAVAANPTVCRELERRFDLTSADIASVQLNALLFAAADKGCGPLAHRLLAAGASVEARDRLGNKPLALAARSGHRALVDLFLEHAAPMHARNIAGSTALYIAAENDRLAVVRLLLDKGADPNLAGRSGATPLAAAAYSGNEAVVEHLLANGADAKAMDATGKAPIVYAASLGFVQIVRRLLDAGVDVNARYGNDLTVLMWTAGYSEGAGARDAEDVAGLLIDRGAAIDAADDRGRSALMIAAEAGYAEMVELLLRRGADRMRKDKSGTSAMELAANDNVRDKLAAQ